MDRAAAASPWLFLQRAVSRAQERIRNISPETRRMLMRSVVLAFAIRVGILLCAYAVGYALLQNEGVHIREIFRSMLDRWDAYNYKIIAERGYPSPGEDRQEIIVFLPGFPYLVRVVQFVIPSFLVAGMLISAVASVAAGYFIQAISRADGHDEQEAARSLNYFFLFPTAYFLAMPYTEGLFMALLLGSFYCARRSNWLGAGIIGAFCTATRFSGIALFPALAVEALHQGKWRGLDRRAIFLLLVPTGFLFYLWLNYDIHGDIFAFQDFQEKYWHHERISPWENLTGAWDALYGPPGFNRFLIWELLLISTALVAGLLAIGVRWLRPSYLVFALLTLYMFLSISFPISEARYVLTIFPIYFVLARLGRNAEVNQAMLTVSTMLLALFYVIYARSWGF